MTHSEASVELLQAEVDEENQSFFRLLVGNRDVKYVTLVSAMWKIHWNDALVAKTEVNGQPYFAHAISTTFPGVKNTWHKISVDYMDLVVGEKLRTGIYEVKCPLFNEVIVAKFARFEWEIPYLESETTAYQWIDGHGIGPQFLGHLMEEGRVIGFLMERIKNARHAGPQDLEHCRQSLSRLHRLGAHHGDTNRFNFLICDSRAILIDFDLARKCDDQGALSEELEKLPKSLEDLSRRGGGGLL
ncbi:hypothetical protein PHISCL_04619 [Aspergillus sclerotialis]|uniref:Alpha-galactosidase A n=1 Tax=Aspergillus sclerotialis TaxID=2070753 RepID=A0A3A2ZUU1_9EURO|nr:hypothetical protein PHISCL_04619 [Aspergillus sclerotialis]